MEASAQSPGGAVYIGPESIILGKYGFDARSVQAAQVWLHEPRRYAWRFLPLFFACLINFVAFGFEGGEFNWSNAFNPLGIIMAMAVAIALPIWVWITFFLDNTTAYVVLIKKDSKWTNAWATLNESAARDVTATILRATSGEQASLSLPPGYRREGDMLLFSDQSFPLQWVSSARRLPRQANYADERSSLLLGIGLLLLASHKLLEAAAGPDSPFQWLVFVLIVAALLFNFSSLGFGLANSSDRSTRYVHIVQLRGTFGRRNVYATLDLAEADAIVATINNEISTNKLP